jgi:hypothetical protein
LFISGEILFQRLPFGNLWNKTATPLTPGLPKELHVGVHRQLTVPPSLLAGPRLALVTGHGGFGKRIIKPSESHINPHGFPAHDPKPSRKAIKGI